jgi:proteasome accessory factor C
MRSRWLLETLQTSEVIEREDGSIEATVQAADPEWLARLVLGQAGGAEVLGPPHTRNLVRDLARSALSRSG